MRSAHDLQQNLVGIGIKWKYGYYDQIRKMDQTMDVLFQEKVYGFLVDTNIKFTIQVNSTEVHVTAFYLPPDVFGTVPMFFLSTDLPENDYLAQTISHKLYDAHLEAKIAAGILLGVGGAKLLEILDHVPEIYHLNEAHGLPLAYYLYHKFNYKIEEVKKRLVFTNHTPEEAGNQKTNIFLLERMHYFHQVPLDKVREIGGSMDKDSEILDHTLAALNMAKISNGVSSMHGDVMRKMWNPDSKVGPIIHITNAQNHRYWADHDLNEACRRNDMEALKKRKKELKKQLFEEVADQAGEIYDENILTIVWARRFAEYKRADLITQDQERFHQLITNKKYPVQIIWAGKPYPMDYGAISIFNRIVHLSKKYSNCSILVGYEMRLSKLLKQGADIWLNTPRITREASGTSGMTASMNAAVNFSIPDGWIPEYSKNGINSFTLSPSDHLLTPFEQDSIDCKKVMDMLEDEIIPMYYNEPQKWMNVVKNSMKDILPFFDADRMAHEYYDKLY
jgi:starch phosphorylase